MPELIILPRSHTVYGHIHNQDNSGLTNNCMSPQMPPMMTSKISALCDLADMLAVFDDEFHQGQLLSPRYAFWSLEDIREWVRDHLTRDLYCSPAEHSQGFAIGSTSKSDIDKLVAKGGKRKSHYVRCYLDSLVTTEVMEWIRDNVAGKHETSIEPVSGGARHINLSFLNETDETMFRVRWTGHGGLSIVE